MSEVKLFRLCGSTPVIDMRTGHNATLRSGLVVMSEDAHTHAIAALEAERDSLRQQLAERDAEIERLQMQLAACGEHVYCCPDCNSAHEAVSKEQAVLLWYEGFRSEPIPVLEAWEAIGHDIGCNPSKQELLDSLRNMAAICEAHGNDMPKPTQQGEAVEVVAWVTPEKDRVITALTVAAAREDGGAMLSSVRPYSVPCMTVAQHQRILAASVPAGCKVVPVERIAIALEAVQNAMEDAYNNAYQECCGRGQGCECCGNPIAAWSDADTAIMDALAPAQRELSALLASAGQEGGKA